MVEFIEIVTILSVVGMISGVLIIALYRVIPKKTAKKQADNSVAEMYSVYNQQVKDVLKIKDSELRSVKVRLKNYESSGDEEEEEITLNPAILTEVSKQIGIPAEQLALMAEIPQVKKMLGDDPNKTIMQYAPLLKGFMSKASGTTEAKSVGM